MQMQVLGMHQPLCGGASARRPATSPPGDSVRPTGLGCVPTPREPTSWELSPLAMSVGPGSTSRGLSRGSITLQAGRVRLGAGKAETFVNKFAISYFFKKHQNNHHEKYQHLIDILSIVSPQLEITLESHFPFAPRSCLWDPPSSRSHGASDGTLARGRDSCTHLSLSEGDFLPFLEDIFT